MPSIEVLLEALPNGALVLDEHRHIVASNAVAERMFAYHREDLLGRGVELIIPEIWPLGTTPSREQLSSSGALRMLGTGRDLEALRRDGTRFPAQVGSSFIRTPEGAALTLLTIVDVTDRKRMEDALRASEHRFRSLADTLPHLVWTCAPDGTCDYVNRRWIDYTGGPAATYLGLGWLEGVHPDDRARLMETWNTAVAGGIEFRCDFRIRRHDGAYRWFDTRAAPQHDREGHIVKWIGSNTDVHEARELGDSLRQEKERLATLAASVPGVLYSFRLHPDGKVSFPYASPAIQDVFGLDPALLTADSEAAFAVIHPLDVERVKASIAASASDLTPWHDEFRVLHPDKGPIWLEGRALPHRDPDDGVTWHGFATDVSERRRAEEELRTSRTQLLSALEAGSMGTWIWDVVRDEAVWDDSLLRLWGLTRDDVAGRGFDFAMGFLHPEDQAGVRAAFADVLREGTDIAGEYRVILDGTLRYMAYRGRVERDSGGRPLRMTGIAIDITAPKRAAEQLLRSQKLEALGTLAGGIAHDFNNILLAITGNTKLAAAGFPPDHPVQEILSEIAKAGNRAAELVRRILAFARAEDQKHAVIELHPVVEEALRLLRSTLPARIEIRADLGTDIPAVAADSSQIHQIVVNLATNSAHAIGEGPGLIDIRLDAAQPSADPDDTVSGLGDHRYARLTVRDTGCGMDQETIGRIFDPFFTTKPPGQGTGLGLSLVHNIVASYDGVITVTSEPGTGTTFHLYFPGVDAVAAAAQPRSLEPGPARSGHVLYIDDEEALVLLVTRLLKRLGYRVTACADAAEALATFRRQPRDFDAVVTDLSMPGMSGFDLAREILAVRPDLPVVMTSGYFHPQDQDLADRLGIRELILKPNTVEELGRALDRLLGAGSLPEAQ